MYSQLPASLIGCNRLYASRWARFCLRDMIKKWMGERERVKGSKTKGWDVIDIPAMLHLVCAHYAHYANDSEFDENIKHVVDAWVNYAYHPRICFQLVGARKQISCCYYCLEHVILRSASWTWNWLQYMQSPLRLSTTFRSVLFPLWHASADVLYSTDAEGSEDEKHSRSESQRVATSRSES